MARRFHKKSEDTMDIIRLLHIKDVKETILQDVSSDESINETIVGHDVLKGWLKYKKRQLQMVNIFQGNPSDLGYIDIAQPSIYLGTFRRIRSHIHYWLTRSLKNGKLMIERLSDNNRSEWNTYVNESWMSLRELEKLEYIEEIFDKHCYSD